MIGRALLVLLGATILGMLVGMAAGGAIGTYIPATYMNPYYGAQSFHEARTMGVGFGIVNGSALGVVAGGLALLYDLGHRFLKTREPKPPAKAREMDAPQ